MTAETITHSAKRIARFGSLGDIKMRRRHVRFTPESRHTTVCLATSALGQYRTSAMQKTDARFGPIPVAARDAIAPPLNEKLRAFGKHDQCARAATH